MDIALRVAQESHAVRKKVGGVLVNDTDIISYGWNGTPAGDDNGCECVNDDGTLTTKPEVLHAETNLFMKLLARGRGISTSGATLYMTLSPCPDCCKLIKQADIHRVVYFEEYRDSTGIKFLQDRGVSVEKYDSLYGDFNEHVHKISDGSVTGINAGIDARNFYRES